MRTPTRSFFLLLLSALAGAVTAHSAPVQVFEAEHYQVGRLTSGPPTHTEINSRARGTAWVRFDGAASGDWLQFTLPSVLPGRYRVDLIHRTDEHMGKCRVEFGAADGSERTVLHAGIDLNEAPEGQPNPLAGRREHQRPGFRRVTAGYTEIELPGYRTIRFTLLERAGGATRLGIDAIELVPDFTMELQPPTALLVSDAGPVHQSLSWSDRSTGEGGFLIERLGPPFTRWTVVGYTPADTTRFVSAGLRPGERYQHRVRAFSSRALGEPSLQVEAASAEATVGPIGTVIETRGGRAGESTAVRLKDGRILLYLNFQEQTHDFSSFTIATKESADSGRTWSPVAPHLYDPSGKTGYMMPSLLRLRDGSIGFSYAVRNQADLVAHRVFCVSRDEGRTWSEPVRITHDLPLTYAGKVFTGATGPHDRLIQTANGDLLLPFHLTTGFADTDTDLFNDRAPHLLYSATVVYRSSDNGTTWERIFGPKLLKGTSQQAPYQYPWFDQLLSEPGLVESSPGHLLILMRNQSGYFYQARSEDGGASWTPVHQSPLRAPLSPAKLVSIAPGMIASVHNPYVGFQEGNLGRRFALGTMTSADGGLTWRHFKILDMGDPVAGNWLFCYPTLLRDDDTWHVFYFGPKGFDLMHRSLPADWFTD